MIKTRLSDKVYQETEKHRHECEVRYCSVMSQEVFDTHLAGVFEKRGEYAYNKLRNDVEKLWKK